METFGASSCLKSLSLLLVLLVGCAGADNAQQLPPHLLDIYDQRTDSLLQEAMQQIQKMTIEEQIGQLIIPVWEPRYDSYLSSAICSADGIRPVSSS